MPQHDTAMRRKAKRHGRERGCWVYITGEELQRVHRSDETPWYRIWVAQSRPRLVVNLYTEP